MRLSEAIRLGAMATPQGFAYLLGSDGSTCALGAACAAVGLLEGVVPDTMDAADYLRAAKKWPLLDVMVDAPEAYAELPNSDAREQVRFIVTTLNDECNWTREQIADWVETIERQQEAKAIPQAEAVTV